MVQDGRQSAPDSRVFRLFSQHVRLFFTIHQTKTPRTRNGDLKIHRNRCYFHSIFPAKARLSRSVTRPKTSDFDHATSEITLKGTTFIRGGGVGMAPPLRAANPSDRARTMRRMASARPGQNTPLAPRVTTAIAEQCRPFWRACTPEIAPTKRWTEGFISLRADVVLAVLPELVLAHDSIRGLPFIRPMPGISVTPCFVSSRSLCHSESPFCRTIFPIGQGMGSNISRDNPLRVCILLCRPLLVRRRLGRTGDTAPGERRSPDVIMASSAG